jgi:hypothetical protein
MPFVDRIGVQVAVTLVDAWVRGTLARARSGGIAAARPPADV